MDNGGSLVGSVNSAVTQFSLHYLPNYLINSIYMSFFIKIEHLIFYYIPTK